MNARRLGCAAAALTAAASGWYFFVYLARWEWNRALTSGVILLAAEIALVGGLVLDRLGRLAADRTAAAGPSRPAGAAAAGSAGGLAGGPADPQTRTLSLIRSAPPEPRDHFAWLRPERAGTNVFVPVLLGAGVVVSAVAWVVERLARATAGGRMEEGLAARLATLAPPPGGLLVPEPDPYALFAPTATAPTATALAAPAAPVAVPSPGGRS